MINLEKELNKNLKSKENEMEIELSKLKRSCHKHDNWLILVPGDFTLDVGVYLLTL